MKREKIMSYKIKILRPPYSTFEALRHKMRHSFETLGALDAVVWVARATLLRHLRRTHYVFEALIWGS